METTCFLCQEVEVGYEGAVCDDCADFRAVIVQFASDRGGIDRRRLTAILKGITEESAGMRPRGERVV